MKNLFLIMAMMLPLAAYADDLPMKPEMVNDFTPTVNDILTEEDFSMLDALLSVPVELPIKTTPLSLLDFGEHPKEDAPVCPIAPHYYNCVAVSPSSLGIGYSTSRFEASFEALINCDLDTPDNESCVVVECL